MSTKLKEILAWIGFGLAALTLVIFMVFFGTFDSLMENIRVTKEPKPPYSDVVGFIKFECPDKMTTGNDSVVIVTVSKNIELFNDKNNVSELRISNPMAIRLDGINYVITAMSTTSQALEDSLITIWRWKVNPTKRGNGTLYLTSTITKSGSQKDYPILNKVVANDNLPVSDWFIKNVYWVISLLAGTGLIIKWLDWVGATKN